MAKIRVECRCDNPPRTLLSRAKVIVDDIIPNKGETFRIDGDTNERGFIEFDLPLGIYRVKVDNGTFISHPDVASSPGKLPSAIVEIIKPDMEFQSVYVRKLIFELPIETEHTEARRVEREQKEAAQQQREAQLQREIQEEERRKQQQKQQEEEFDRLRLEKMEQINKEEEEFKKRKTDTFRKLAEEKKKFNLNR